MKQVNRDRSSPPTGGHPPVGDPYPGRYRSRVQHSESLLGSRSPHALWGEPQTPRDTPQCPTRQSGAVMAKCHSRRCCAAVRWPVDPAWRPMVEDRARNRVAVLGGCIAAKGIAQHMVASLWWDPTPGRTTIGGSTGSSDHLRFWSAKAPASLMRPPPWRRAVAEKF